MERRVLAALISLAAFLPSAGTCTVARASDVLPLADVLANYRNAMADADSQEPATIVESGTTTGAGLTGSFATWSAGERERGDVTLGPSTERTLLIGDHVWYADENGDVRALNGVLLRRALTQRFIDSGNFANHPDRCALRGRAQINGRQSYAVDVTAAGGDTETLYLDATTFLPYELAFDDADGRSTVDYADWRTVAGRRYAYTSIFSDGDHAFDTTERTTSIELGQPIAPSIFAPLVERTIAMDLPETVGLQLRDGHFYVPVRIAGRTFSFLLDTGSQDIVLDRSVAAQLGLAGVGALEASGATRTGGVSLVKLPQLTVGTRGVMNDLVVTTLDLGRSTQGAFRIDGVLGYPFFASTVARFDPAARTLTFGPPQSITPAGERVALSTDRGFPEAMLRIDAQLDAPFVIDTGNAGELLLYRPFAQHHAGIVEFSTTARHTFGVGGAAASYRSTLDQLQIGTIPLYHVDTDVMQATRGAFADRFDAGNVGLGVLDNFRLTFDLPDEAIYVERGADFDDGRSRN